MKTFVCFWSCLLSLVNRTRLQRFNHGYIDAVRSFEARQLIAFHSGVFRANWAGHTMVQSWSSFACTLQTIAIRLSLIGVCCWTKVHDRDPYCGLKTVATWVQDHFTFKSSCFKMSDMFQPSNATSVLLSIEFLRPYLHLIKELSWN